MNNDVVQEILFHLPVQSLFRFRAVSKSWRDIIDSPSFRELHNNNDDNNNNNNNSTVCLELINFLLDPYQKLSIKLLDNGKSFALPHNFDDLLPQWWHPNDENIRLVGPVKGLICIYSEKFKAPGIAICNPFLGQLKILPTFPSLQCGAVKYRKLGFGFDLGGDYKVVEMVYYFDHCHSHARVYSRRRDSWRELAGDGVFDKRYLRIIKSVKSSSKNGHSAHWIAPMEPFADLCVVLSFDMRNEVFRATKMGDSYRRKSEILAMDGEGGGYFVVFYLGSKGRIVEVYEQGSDLQRRKYWKVMVDLEETLMWRGVETDYVVLKNNVNRGEREVCLYDYRARKFVGRFKLPESSEIVEYIGSFISIE